MVFMHAFLKRLISDFLMRGVSRMWGHVLKLPQELLILTHSSELPVRSVTTLRLPCSKEAKPCAEAVCKLCSEQPSWAHSLAISGPGTGYLSEEAIMKVDPLAPASPRSIYHPPTPNLSRSN